MISIQNVKKRYGKQILFDDLTISFVSGQRIALIGANGTGKTSLLRMILGLEKPDQGAVAVPTDTFHRPFTAGSGSAFVKIAPFHRA